MKVLRVFAVALFASLGLALAACSSSPESRGTGQGSVLVVGIDSLMTQLAKCCKPAPPDAIVGFVTRGKGVSIHRADCSNLREMAARNGERVIDVEWGSAKTEAFTATRYVAEIGRILGL